MLPTRAFLENALAGLKTRFSTRWDSMFWLMGVREANNARCPAQIESSWVGLHRGIERSRRSAHAAKMKFPLLLIPLLVGTNVARADFAAADLAEIGRKVWHNECAGSVE